VIIYWTEHVTNKALTLSLRFTAGRLKQTDVSAKLIPPAASESKASELRLEEKTGSTKADLTRISTVDRNISESQSS